MNKHTQTHTIHNIHIPVGTQTHSQHGAAGARGQGPGVRGQGPGAWGQGPLGPGAGEPGLVGVGLWSTHLRPSCYTPSEPKPQGVSPVNHKPPIQPISKRPIRGAGRATGS